MIERDLQIIKENGEVVMVDIKRKVMSSQDLRREIDNLEYRKESIIFEVNKLKKDYEEISERVKLLTEELFKYKEEEVDFNLE